jgi:hypothetical protein
VRSPVTKTRALPANAAGMIPHEAVHRGVRFWRREPVDSVGQPRDRLRRSTAPAAPQVQGSWPAAARDPIIVDAPLLCPSTTIPPPDPTKSRMVFVAILTLPVSFRCLCRSRNGAASASMSTTTYATMGRAITVPETAPVLAHRRATVALPDVPPIVPCDGIAGEPVDAVPSRLSAVAPQSQHAQPPQRPRASRLPRPWNAVMGTSKSQPAPA